jgi:hypothetical protein
VQQLRPALHAHADTEGCTQILASVLLVEGRDVHEHAIQFPLGVDPVHSDAQERFRIWRGPGIDSKREAAKRALKYITHTRFLLREALCDVVSDGICRWQSGNKMRHIKQVAEEWDLAADGTVAPECSM